MLKLIHLRMRIKCRSVKQCKMSDKELLTNYRENVDKLRETAKSIAMTDDEINELFEDCLRNLSNDENVNNSTRRSLASRILFLFKLIFIFLIIFVLVFILLNHHQPTLSLVLRNVQGFIYPSLKLLRLLAMPVIKVFPTISELYDETCLIENPYFEVSNMECWPCEDVHSVINLTDSRNYSLYQSGIPYIIKTLDKSVSLEDIQELYKNNSVIFTRDAQRIKSNNPEFVKSADLLHFHPSNKSNTHISWRINRMIPARIVRTLFPKPYIISRWSGQSTERYVMIDDLHAIPYVLPNPECSSVILTQSRGERTIVLRPSKECNGQCRTTSVTLKATYSLSYNWWYWRPISFPSQNATDDISISYITSFC